MFVGFRLELGCWVGVNMNASGLLNFRCCALRLEGKSQVGIIPTCVSSEGRITPCCTNVARLPTSACASMEAPCVPCWIALIIICPAAAWLHPASVGSNPSLAIMAVSLFKGMKARAVKTTPHNSQGKAATLVLGTVKFPHHKKRRKIRGTGGLQT